MISCSLATDRQGASSSGIGRLDLEAFAQPTEAAQGDAEGAARIVVVVIHARSALDVFTWDSVNVLLILSSAAEGSDGVEGKGEEAGQQHDGHGDFVESASDVAHGSGSPCE